MKNSLLKLAILISGAALAFLGFRTLADHQLAYHKDKENNLLMSLKNAEGLIVRSHPYKALKVLEEVSSELNVFPQHRKKWAEIAILSAVELKDATLLKSLYEENEADFLENEKAALLLATQLIVEGQPHLVEPLFEHWNKETSPHKEEWILLLADLKAILGQHEQLLALLQPENLKKENEFNRLLRLSLIHLHEHPKVSWDFLTQASALNYESASIEYYRTHLLSGNGHSDLTSKLLKKIGEESKDSFYAEELIYHYLNENLLPDAYALIEKALIKNPTVPLIQQGIFIHKVYRPLKYEWGRLNMNDHPETPFIRYLLAIPLESLWDESLLYSQKTVAKHANEDIESQWLATLQALKINDDIKALMILRAHPEMGRISPYLYIALQQAILVKNPHLPYSVSIVPMPSKQYSKIKYLVENPSSQETKQLFADQDAYSLLLLAAGWDEAFLKLNADKIKQTGWPSWAVYQATQALRNNRSANMAIAYAKHQPQTQKLKLLLSQVYLETGDTSNAYALIEPLLTSSSQAAALWSAYLMQANRYPLAKKTILDNPIYKDSIQGQERLAFLEYKLGHIEEADLLYRKLINQSSQAKSYWAAKAFQTKNYALAQKLLTKLVEEFPSDDVLKKQLADVSALVD